MAHPTLKSASQLGNISPLLVHKDETVIANCSNSKDKKNLSDKTGKTSV